MRVSVSRDRNIIRRDASGGLRSSRDGGADSTRLRRAHDACAPDSAMHADPESPCCREETQLLPDEWLKVKTVPTNGNLSPGVYYPTGSKRFVDATKQLPSPTETIPYCFAFVRLLAFRLILFLCCINFYVNFRILLCTISVRKPIEVSVYKRY